MDGIWIELIVEQSEARQQVAEVPAGSLTDGEVGGVGAREVQVLDAHARSARPRRRTRDGQN